VRSYTATGWFHIKGRGDVAAVVNDEEFQRDTQHLIGERVMIDGNVYTVVGVETFCLEWIREGAPISLLVKEGRVVAHPGEDRLAPGPRIV
jgi:hypothetical protein